MTGGKGARSGGCCYNFREEFQAKKFDLEYEYPSAFVRPECFSPILYIPWTIIWALYYISIVISEIVYERNTGGVYFTKATNLSLILQTVSIFVDCGITIYVHVARKDIIDGEITRMPWYMKIQWVLFNVTNSFSILVTLMYFIFLDVELTHGSIYGHITNSVYTILGLLFCAKPVQLFHVYQPVIWTFLYIIFTIIYYIFGAAPIYDPLDWGDETTQSAVFAALVVFVAIPLGHVLCYILYSIRVLIGRMCSCNDGGKE